MHQEINNVQDNRLVARRGDLLAALCQETVGDHSWVTRSNLQCALDEFDNKIALIQHYSSDSRSSDVSSSISVESIYREKLLDTNPLTWLLQRQIKRNIEKMPRLIAIIRAKNAIIRRILNRILTDILNQKNTWKIEVFYVICVINLTIVALVYGNILKCVI